MAQIFSIKGRPVGYTSKGNFRAPKRQVTTAINSDFQDKFCGGRSCEFKQFNVTIGGEQVSLISPILKQVNVSEENLRSAISPIVDLKIKDLEQMNKLSANIYSSEGFLTSTSLSFGEVSLLRKSVENIKGSHLVHHFFKKSRKSVKNVTAMAPQKGHPH